MTTFIDAESSRETNIKPTSTTRLKVPRLASLLHRLQRAKDAKGRPIPLLDEILFFLDDPSPGTGDRWQEGADLCAKHGIQTSRMSVWRLYRAHILEWRREQNPAPPTPPPSAEETVRLHDQARHLAAQRALEMLNDPHLAPGQLIGLLQADNHRQQLALARDRFNDRVEVRKRLEEAQRLERFAARIEEETLKRERMESAQRFLAALHPIPPDTTPSRNIPAPPSPQTVAQH